MVNIVYTVYYLVVLSLLIHQWLCRYIHTQTIIVLRTIKAVVGAIRNNITTHRGGKKSNIKNGSLLSIPMLDGSWMMVLREKSMDHLFAWLIQTCLDSDDWAHTFPFRSHPKEKLLLAISPLFLEGNTLKKKSKAKSHCNIFLYWQLMMLSLRVDSLDRSDLLRRMYVSSTS